MTARDAFETPPSPPPPDSRPERLRLLLERQPLWLWGLVALVCLVLEGFVDYITGYEFSGAVFYLLGVGLSAWFVGRPLGFAMALASSLVWLAADRAAGAHYANPLAPIWNTFALMAFLCLAVELLVRLHALHRSLAARVQHRTLALRREMAERARLEKELLEIGEHERRRIGRDLHDGLCQHLTGTALASQVLAERLAAHGRPEAADAARVADLIEEGIRQARHVARGLYPVEREGGGLLAALRHLAAQTASQHGVVCQCTCAAPVQVHDAARATHLFYIAQEAVRNALQHGHARHIHLTLTPRAGQVQLGVEDDGAGLPADFRQREGLGIRIMEHRAAMVDGTFAIRPGTHGGTMVTCTFPNELAPITR